MRVLSTIVPIMGSLMASQTLVIRKIRDTLAGAMYITSVKNMGRAIEVRLMKIQCPKDARVSPEGFSSRAFLTLSF